MTDIAATDAMSNLTSKKRTNMYITVVTIDSDEHPHAVGWTVLEEDELVCDEGAIFLTPCEAFYIKTFDTHEEASKWGEDMAVKLANYEVLTYLEDK
jgi:hypothetical protein